MGFRECYYTSKFRKFWKDYKCVRERVKEAMSLLDGVHPLKVDARDLREEIKKSFWEYYERQRQILLDKELDPVARLQATFYIISWHMIDQYKLAIGGLASKYNREERRTLKEITVDAKKIIEFDLCLLERKISELQ